MHLTDYTIMWAALCGFGVAVLGFIYCFLEEPLPPERATPWGGWGAQQQWGGCSGHDNTGVRTVGWRALHSASFAAGKSKTAVLGLRAWPQSR